MGEWIGVLDSLPKNGEIVVFVDMDQFGFMATAAGYFHSGHFYLDTDGIEASNYDGSANISLTFKPTHWLPLPSPKAIKEQ